MKMANLSPTSTNMSSIGEVCNRLGKTFLTLVITGLLADSGWTWPLIIILPLFLPKGNTIFFSVMSHLFSPCEFFRKRFKTSTQRVQSLDFPNKNWQYFFLVFSCINKAAGTFISGICFSNFFSVSVHFCLLLFIPVRFCLILFVLDSLCPFLSVSVFLGILSVLPSAHIENFIVSNMQDFSKGESLWSHLNGSN